MYLITRVQHEPVRKKAIAHLHTLLRAADDAVLLLCSGGSALALLDTCFDDVDWVRVTIGMVDERWRAQKSDRNSNALLQTALVQKARARGACVITIDHTTTTKDVATDRYQERLHQWHEENSTGIVVAILGIGPDGHTAGIMPFSDDIQTFMRLFDNAQRWVCGYDATGKNPFVNRVTLTLPYLRTRIDHAIVYVVGREKCAVLQHIVANDVSVAMMPAQIIHAMRDVRIFTDCAVLTNDSDM